MSVDVLVITDDADPASVLPALPVVAHRIRRTPLTEPGRTDHRDVDVVIVDGRADLPAARRACRMMAADAPQIAVVAVVLPEDLVAVDLDWQLDEVLLTTCSTAELHSRLRLAISRRLDLVDSTLQLGDLALHPASYSASLHGQELHLTVTEFKLLSFLVEHAGHAVTRSRLLNAVWGRTGSRRTVDVHVQRLRAKLGHDHEHLVETVRGVGYRAVSGNEPLDDAPRVAMSH